MLSTFLHSRPRPGMESRRAISLAAWLRIFFGAIFWGCCYGAIPSLGPLKGATSSNRSGFRRPRRTEIGQLRHRNEASTVKKLVDEARCALDRAFHRSVICLAAISFCGSRPDCSIHLPKRSIFTLRRSFAKLRTSKASNSLISASSTL